MNSNGIYASYAIMRELNSREFGKKLDLFPDELRQYAVLSTAIIGAETAKRIPETPAAVIKDGEGFVSGLMEIIDTTGSEVFVNVLQTCLIEAIKDELRFCCSNCRKFNTCLDLENLELGNLFRIAAEGGETEDLKLDIAAHVMQALLKTPYVDKDDAQNCCSDFSHQYTPETVADLFSRYSDISASLQNQFGMDYRCIQQAMIAINMEFCEKQRK